MAFVLCRRLCVAVLMTASAPAHAAPLEVSSRPIDLHTEDPQIQSVGALRFRGGIEMRSSNRRFGGLSGMSVSRDGARLSAVTDKGWWVVLRLVYDPSGRLVGVENGEIGKLLAPDGMAIVDRGGGDAESIARAGGGLVVSFEIDKKLYFYPPGANPLASRPKALVTPAALRGAPSNGAVEALTVLHGGSIFALTERFAYGENAVMGWVTWNRAWQPVIYQRYGNFYPTGAVTLPAGDVLVLERRFNWIAGVASRIVRISPAEIVPGARIKAREVALLDPPLTVENFEAIDARTGPGGATMIYILSDDNFNLLQRNLLLMFRLGQ
jgi:hypothetical protein